MGQFFINELHLMFFPALMKPVQVTCRQVAVFRFFHKMTRIEQFLHNHIVHHQGRANGKRPAFELVQNHGDQRINRLFPILGVELEIGCQPIEGGPDSIGHPLPFACEIPSAI